MFLRLAILFFSSTALLFCSVFGVFAQDPANPNQEIPYYKDSKRGWYWYELKPEPIKEEEKKPEETKKHRMPSLAEYSPEQLWNMYPDDFQALLIDFQKKAVMNPSEANVADYYYIQDIARRKSLAFANTTAMVMQTHPELSVAKDYPSSPPGIRVLNTQRRNEVSDKIKDSRDKFGLIFFYSPTCQYCVEQEKILQFFEERYGWEIKRVNFTTEKGLADMFSVSMVPTLILVYKDSKSPITVSAGVISLQELELSLYRAIRLLTGEISPQEYSIYDFQKGGAFDVKAPPPKRNQERRAQP